MISVYTALITHYYIDVDLCLWTRFSDLTMLVMCFGQNLCWHYMYLIQLAPKLNKAPLFLAIVTFLDCSYTDTFWTFHVWSFIEKYMFMNVWENYMI